jgi:hypothetical protein
MFTFLRGLARWARWGLLIYFVAYVCLSRYGYYLASQSNIKGFYFIQGTDEVSVSANRFLVICFSPAIYVDCALGTGSEPASDPMTELSRGVR